MNKSIGILTISLFMAFLACGDSESKEVAVTPAEKPLNVFYVRTSPVATSGLNDVIHVTGVIQSDTEAKPSFKTGGVIARTYVKEGDYGNGDEGCDTTPSHEVEPGREPFKPAVKEACDRFFGHVTQQNRGNGDAELGGGELAVEIVQGLLYDPGLAVSLLDEGVDPGFSRSDQGELGRDEEGVRRQKNDDGENAKTIRRATSLFHGG